MPELNWLAIAAAALAVFVVSTVYYIVFAARMVELRQGNEDAGGVQPWKIGVELVRSLVLATVIAGLARLLDITDLGGALQLGLALWVGFPVILLVGSVIWENVAPALATIHAGDWLLKLLIVATIVSLWT
ncbi:MAG TPA: DUF1761 domain-containing protein [Candidatus Angelobacter sp.]|nr:DUF1761 domain-containing protein [Candidatus Angelobacter sp.]